MSNEARFRAFKIEVDDFFEREAPEAVAQATRKIALEGLTRVVKKTPVKDGGARGNWQAGIGEAPEDVLDVEDKSGDATISKGQAVIVGAQPFMPIILANNLPYILKLEDGSSQQAPAGMVGLTVAELESIFRTVPDA